MKLAITVQSGTLIGKKLEFSEGFFTIGRSAGCNLIFNPTEENMVSSKHGYIEAKADGFYLIDDKSTNGTFVNGNRIQVIKLNSGDIIQFGKNGPEAKIFIEQPMQGSQDQATMVLNQENNSQATIVKPHNFNPPPVQEFNTQPLQSTSSPQMQPTQMGNFAQSQMPQTAGNFPRPTTGLRNSFSHIGLGNPDAGNKAEQTEKYVGLSAFLIIFIFFTMVVTWLVVSDLGIVVTVFVSFVAFIPAAFYILPLMGIDRYDPEPPWLLALAFSWGALVAVVISYYINSGVGRIAYIATRDPVIADLVSAVISAPIFEESSKGLGVLLLLVLFRKYFDDILDGIVYGGVIALGFATVENMFYYGRGFNKEGIATLLVLFLIRGILTPFAHVLFTSMTGIGCGISRESHNSVIKFIMPMLGYAAAVCLHALWNGLSILVLIIMKNAGLLGVCSDVGLGGERTGTCVFIIGYAVLEVPLFLVFVAFTIYIMRRQNRILKGMLAIDVARGVIPQEHLDIATSVFRSTGWVYGSLLTGKYSARSKYLRAVGKFGLSYWHIQRATAAQGQTASFQQNPILRDEVLKWRDQV